MGFASLRTAAPWYRLRLVSLLLLQSLNSNFVEVYETLKAFSVFLKKKKRTGKPALALKYLGDKSSLKPLWKNTVSQKVKGLF